MSQTGEPISRDTHTGGNALGDLGGVIEVLGALSVGFVAYGVLGVVSYVPVYWFLGRPGDSSTTFTIALIAALAFHHAATLAATAWATRPPARTRTVMIAAAVGMLVVLAPLLSVLSTAANCIGVASFPLDVGCPELG